VLDQPVRADMKICLKRLLCMFENSLHVYLPRYFLSMRGSDGPLHVNQ
jgi:hypothetical protein